MVTLKDVAAKAGVSMSTASGAMRGLDSFKPQTIRKVRKIAEELGYKTNVSAKSLRSGRNDTITFLTSGIQGVYFSQLATCFANELHKRGLHMLIELSQYIDDDANTGTTFMMTDGIIATNARNVSKILGSHPTVLLEDYSEDCLYDTVNAPSAAGSRAAIRHLYEKGCRRIGIVGNVLPETVDFGFPRDVRLYAAADELKRLGIDYDPSNCLKTIGSRQGGRELAHRLADEGLQYDGLYCLSDGIALGMLLGFAERGIKVPEQVAVIGFDGVVEDEFSFPTLSTIATDFEGMASTAVSMLMRRIEHPEDELSPQRVSVGYRLIERASTAR
ncbi:LacI family DNA-binding transcriptional regulator [Bifidobacterium sp. LC6]|uniref:LacI family DNA-binding transcriptional regulator n=1 Tax=Bifidobacterium colobi TaxID=2809026 RepID=A0ABS5UUW4_9BIFI|nr:LacI family DNA-binding transcriptional regulator [Bifidobacterium colobi]MBT1174602.1 LacI family DNA-binding transcriptional regulator [Bifidobacterium colobi]